MLFRYRWAHHLCFLSMNDLSRSSFFDLSTQQETIYSRAHLVLTNLLITSLLVLCFSRWFLLFLPPKFLLISCRPLDSYTDLLFRYRWAHHLCFLSMNDLSRSSFFDLSIHLLSIWAQSYMWIGGDRQASVFFYNIINYVFNFFR